MRLQLVREKKAAEDRTKEEAAKLLQSTKEVSELKRALAGQAPPKEELQIQSPRSEMQYMTEMDGRLERLRENQHQGSISNIDHRLANILDSRHCPRILLFFTGIGF